MFNNQVNIISNVADAKKDKRVFPRDTECPQTPKGNSP